MRVRITRNRLDGRAFSTGTRWHVALPLAGLVLAGLAVPAGAAASTLTVVASGPRRMTVRLARATTLYLDSVTTSGAVDALGGFALVPSGSGRTVGYAAWPVDDGPEWTALDDQLRPKLAPGVYTLLVTPTATSSSTTWRLRWTGAAGTTWRPTAKADTLRSAAHWDGELNAGPVVSGEAVTSVRLRPSVVFALLTYAASSRGETIDICLIVRDPSQANCFDDGQLQSWVVLRAAPALAEPTSAFTSYANLPPAMYTVGWSVSAYGLVSDAAGEVLALS